MRARQLPKKRLRLLPHDQDSHSHRKCLSAAKQATEASSAQLEPVSAGCRTCANQCQSDFEGHIETRNRGGSTICILCIFESIELHRHRRFALCTVAALPNLFASFTVIAMLRTSRWRQAEPLAQWRALARCLELLRWPASSDGVVLREEVLDTLLRSWSCVCPGL